MCRKDLLYFNKSWEKESVKKCPLIIKEAYQKTTGQQMQQKATSIIVSYLPMAITLIDDIEDF